jgi:phage tail protein X
MKSFLVPRGGLFLTTAALVLALMGLPALAAEHPDEERQTQRRPRADHIFSLQGAPELGNVSTLLDQPVRNRRGEDVGNLRDFVVDRDGQIKYAVLGHGGVLGVGEQWTAVDWELFEVAPQADHFILNATSEQVAEAPTFDQDNWPSEPQIRERRDWAAAPDRRDETRRTVREDTVPAEPDRWAVRRDDREARTVTIEKGETLSGLAQEIYGRADLWEYIYEANRDKIADPHNVPAGTQLVIPEAPRR